MTSNRFSSQTKDIILVFLGEDSVALSSIDSQKMNLTLSSQYEYDEQHLWISPGSVHSSIAEFDSTFEIMQTIGRGQTSVVKVVRRRDNGMYFACKFIDKHAMALNRLRDEIKVLLAIRHPNIVSLHQVFETESDLRLIMELAEGGELFNRITSKRFYSEREACEVVTSLLSAVSFLHQRNIIHRDIKPENILLAHSENDVEIKLSDFGYAKMFEDLDLEEVYATAAGFSVVGSPLLRPKSRQVRAFTTVGTDYYIAPEILNGGGYGTSVDMWSIGVVAYILLCGFPPFPDVNKIREGVYSFPSPFWDGVSGMAQDFISALLTVDPDLRSSAPKSLQHPWITTRHKGDCALSPHHSQMFRKFNKKRRGFQPSEDGGGNDEE